MARFVGLLAFVVGSALMVAQSPGAPSESPVVYTADVDGLIHPVSAEYMIDDDGPRRPRGRDPRRLHASHPGWLGRFHPRHRHPHARRQDADCHLHRAVRRTGRVGWFPAHDRRGCRRDGSWHPSRCGASGGWEWGANGPDDGEETGGGCRGLRPDAGQWPTSKRDVRGASGDGQPGVHRAGSADGLAPAGRSRRERYPCAVAIAGWPTRDTFQRHDRGPENRRRPGRTYRDELAAAFAERRCTSQCRLPALEPRDAWTHRRTVESRCGAARRRRRTMSLAGVFRAADSPRELCRPVVAPLRVYRC